jgi:hypothetical protein
MSSGNDKQHDQRDTADATEEDVGYTELIHSMTEFIPEGELSNIALWKLGYVPPLHLRLPWFSYGPQAQCTFDEILSEERERRISTNSEGSKSMDIEGSSGSADTRPIPASYYSTSPVHPQLHP